MVFDTNVFAYALLNVPERREQAAHALEKSSEVLVPDLFRAEIANVAWMWIRAQKVPVEVGLVAIRKAEAIVTKVVSTNLLWEEALALALQQEHSVYDTLFVALAELEGTRVVTYDRRMIEHFPDYTISVSEFLRK